MIRAAEAGKDIYCEKPLSLTVEQGRVMSDTVRRYGIVFQTGTQLRSMHTNRFGCELVRNGRIGEVREVHIRPGPGMAIESQPEMPVPPGFDYDMWLGPAPWAPYTEQRCHGVFRSILDYSGGQVTDHGAHYYDIAQWGLGTEATGPIEFEGRGDFPRTGLWNAALQYRIECTYANGIRMIVSHMGDAAVKFVGTEGTVCAGDGGSWTDPPALARSVIGPAETHLYQSNNHRQNFLDCIRSRSETIAPIETAHRAITIGHICNIAMKLERKLRWNPDKERFVNDPEADRMLSRPMRPPWTL